ncbi:hypothetical protein KUG47_10725 [Falsochrobactrum sp. TDYN1]|uniref:Uncharacterized protein n=1 Tax=Falsochrobactrum tianjinense TaxID=2706015 RepID=A0A949UUN2_9HYPH|nr:hypothetical protein [Falsochrobactrum sp. TDYN1]MBV2143967.1 hypothetical protein [Falsochrobactrum sp. TDYN1]
MWILIVAITALTGFVTTSPADAAVFRVCHGYDCYYRTSVTLTKQDERRIRNLLAKGSWSAASERKALRAAIAIFEQRGTAAIGIRDKPRMQFGKSRIKGQMDCIDESTNTDSFLRYLQSRHWLKYHSPARKAARGSFIDGRYPHWTAVIEENGAELWAVDSWYEAGGGPPDIMLLNEWKRRGYGGQR